MLPSVIRSTNYVSASGKTLEEIDAIFMRHSPTLSDTNLEGAYVDHLPTKSSNMVAENDKVEKHEIGSTHIG